MKKSLDNKLRRQLNYAGLERSKLKSYSRLRILRLEFKAPPGARKTFKISRVSVVNIFDLLRKCARFFIYFINIRSSPPTRASSPL